MKAIVINEFGGADKLQLTNIETPTPGPDEVLIKLVFTAVNPVDWKIREGLLQKRKPHDFPIILGWDASGVISDIGSNVKKFKPGDEVFAYCQKPKVKWGTYAEYITLPEDFVAFKPKNISFAQAAAFPLSGLTAWQCLFDVLKLKKGETILIHAGAGGVGSLAIQFARQIGAKIFTTATQAKHDYVKQLGADLPIDYKNESFVERIKKLHPQGIDAVFDTLGAQTLKYSFQVLKRDGRLVSIVEPPEEEFAEKFKVKAFYHFVSPNGRELQMISDLISTKKIQPINIQEMPLEAAAEAQEINRQGHTTGKIVLKI